MTQARLPSQHRESGDESHEAVFSDPTELTGPGGYFGNEPPTWMDPHLLVRMAMQRPEVQKLLAEAFQRNKLSVYRKRLQELLQTVFEEDYLPYMFEKFGGYASEITAQWMLMNHCDQELNRPQPVKRRRTKKETDHVGPDPTEAEAPDAED